MKKNLCFICSILMLILTTGCGKKILTCKGNIAQNDINYKVEVVGNFLNDKLKVQTIQMETDLTNYLQYTDINSFVELYEQQYEKFNDYNGVSVSVSNTDNSVIVVMNIDLEQVDSETYKFLDIGNGSLEMSIEAFEDEFKKMDFSCE